MSGALFLIEGPLLDIEFVLALDISRKFVFCYYEDAGLLVLKARSGANTHLRRRFPHDLREGVGSRTVGLAVDEVVVAYVPVP